tara:strand:+ start:2562 stop:3224 length:663 start_codon:yes stop_codon:yes gene_type:complete
LNKKTNHSKEINFVRCESANQDIQNCRKSTGYASHLALLANMFMGDSYTNNQSNQSGRGDFQNHRQPGRNNFRGGRGPNSREGGFRIRLSDNEMRAARSLQEAFNLRSTVAVLGFAVRTLAQMLEDGSLDNLVNEYRSQAPSNNLRRSRGGTRGNFDENSSSIKTKPNPFARPEKPVKEEEISDSEQTNNVAQDPLEKDNDQESENSSHEDDITNTSEQG